MQTNAMLLQRLNAAYAAATERYICYDDHLRQKTLDMQEALYYRGVANDIISAIEGELKTMFPGSGSTVEQLLRASDLALTGEQVNSLEELATACQDSLRFSYEQARRSAAASPDILELSTSAQSSD
jgi:hypothetical protein